MKKVLSLVCVLAMVATCLFVFASCGATPNSDPAEAEAALKEAGYTVVNATSEGVGVITATKDEDTVTINYCADEDAAQKAYDQIEETYAALKEIADELGEDLGVEWGISGTMVWVGTPDAISAAA